MKDSQNGFIAPILLALIAILLIGGGAYAYLNKVLVENQTPPQIEPLADTNEQPSPTPVAQTPVAVTIVGAVYNSVYIKSNGENSEFLFIDKSNKQWTVYYRNASFRETSYTTGRVNGTDGLLNTTLQAWIKGQPNISDFSRTFDGPGTPGTITITGHMSDDGVLVASSINIDGQ